MGSLSNPESLPYPSLSEAYYDPPPDPNNLPMHEFNPMDFPPVDVDFLSHDFTVDESLMIDLGIDDFDFIFDDVVDLPVHGDGSEEERMVSDLTQCGGLACCDDQNSNSDDAGGVSRVLNSNYDDGSGVSMVLNSRVLNSDSGGEGEGNDVSRVLNSNYDGGGVSMVLNSMVLNSRVLNSDSGGEGEGPASSQDSGGGGVSGFLNSPSTDSDGFSAASESGTTVRDEEGKESFPDSPNASDSGTIGNKEGKEFSPDSIHVQSDVVVVIDQKIKLEDEGKECLSKRKKENDDDKCNPNPRSSKLRRSSPAAMMIPSGDVTDPVIVDDEHKKKARLMRNRESAQLSRQRKKHYVEELEDKVRAMHSTIADLNSKISFFMAENVSLRQQLSGGGSGGVHPPPPPPGMYPHPTMAHMPYPWMPYGMRSQGSQVPLIPIPRLKTQQPASAPKAKRGAESKKKESKTKKVASVSLLGLLFFLFLFGGLVPFVNVRYRESRDVVDYRLGFTNYGLNSRPRGRVLTVNGFSNESDQSIGGVGLCNGKSGYREGDSGRLNCKNNERGSRASPGSDGFKHSVNGSEPLVASLYVPRNDKLVKIDGNLIIHSVLASEKAMASSRAASGVKTDKATASSSNEAKETGLAIPNDLAPALVGGGNVGRNTHLYRILDERQKALASGSGDTYNDNAKSNAADRSLQKWFLEGVAGPILSSGMCTEVFQFEVSPASSNPSGIIPAASIANISAEHQSDSPHRHRKGKNRRVLNHLPVPVVGTAYNETEERPRRPSQNGSLPGNKSASSSMIVSVLVDDSDGMITPKSLSRIFVVVLLDSVKYVTYSCVLPLKGSGLHHLVTT